MNLIPLNLLFVAFFSLVFSFILLYFLLPQLEKYFLTKPNLRSSHKLPKPSGGGIVFVFIYCFGSVTFGNTSPLIYLPLSFIGFIDDLYDLNRFLRYLIQVVTSFLIISKSYFFNNYLIDLNPLLLILIFCFLILFITAIINFINFMDGIDGLVSSSLIVVFITSAILTDPYLLILVGALIGFLFWNWYPSKIFMGDVGSTFLGAVLAGTLINQYNFDNFFKIIYVASPLLLDAFICVLRRFFTKQPIFKSHCLHLYQRLYQAGWSHSKVTIFYLLPIILMALLLIFNSYILLLFGLASLLVYGYYLDLKIAVPFKISLEKTDKSFSP